VLYEADFPVRGATRFEQRRQVCERLMVDDNVKLEREPDNIHDSNAILILGDDDCELGYVPREEARDIAPLLDAGAEADARVRRLWETPEGKVVPIVLAKVRQGDARAEEPFDGIDQHCLTSLRRDRCSSDCARWPWLQCASPR
jgi:HIRAN domain